MKKLLTLISICICFSLCACSGIGNKTVANQTPYNNGVLKYNSVVGSISGISVEMDGHAFSLTGPTGSMDNVHGTYEERNGKVIMQAENNPGETYVFDRDGDSLHFNPTDSSVSARASLPDNTILSR